MTEAPSTSIGSAIGAEPGIRFERDRAAITWTLDRATKLNAINSGMKAAIANEIPRIARDPQVYVVLLRAVPGRMFCAGGDIREIYDIARGDPRRAAEECAREYSLIWLLDSFSKPSVAMIDGPVMGTGVGIVQTATHRVAGPNYRFQMPETQIGYFPDNGVCFHLAQLPHEIGTWLGLTGESIGPADALWLDLITHCIDASRFDAIAAELADAQPIDDVLAAHHTHPGEAPLIKIAPVVERCFAANTTSEIIEALRVEKSEREWCTKTIAALESRSPLALETTLRHLRRSRYLDLRQTLIVDYRLAVKLVTGNDFLEGVRARVIEKQGDPRWNPAVLSDLSGPEVERLFDSLGDAELQLPTRHEMQALRV